MVTARKNSIVSKDHCHGPRSTNCHINPLRVIDETQGYLIVSPQTLSGGLHRRHQNYHALVALEDFHSSHFGHCQAIPRDLLFDILGLCTVRSNYANVSRPNIIRNQLPVEIHYGQHFPGIVPGPGEVLSEAGGANTEEIHSPVTHSTV